MTLETTLVWDRWAGPREIPPQGYRAKGVERQPVKPGVSVGGQRGPKLNAFQPALGREDPNVFHASLGNLSES